MLLTIQVRNHATKPRIMSGYNIYIYILNAVYFNLYFLRNAKTECASIVLYHVQATPFGQAN